MNAPLEHELFGLAKLIKSWLVAGLNVQEIQARLAGADKVAQDLLEGAARRRKAGQAFLGRAPAKGMADAVMIPVEEAPAPNKDRNQ